MLISIAGPSCSGKTTLARLLGEALRAPTFHLDRHYLAGVEHPLVDGHPSFEQPHQYDAAALRATVDAALADNPIVIAEGFLLLTYPCFANASDLSACLDIPHNVLADRRAARAAQAAAASDVAGGRVKKADDGWQAHGRGEWERFGASQLTIPGVRIIKPTQFGGADPDAAEDIAAALLAEWRLVERLAA